MKLLAAALFFLAVPLFGSEVLDLARANLKEWVKVEKSISLEKHAWRNKKEVMLDLIGVLEKESEALRSRLEEIGRQQGESNNLREELLKKEASLADSIEAIELFLRKMEGQVWALSAWLPQPLVQKLEPFFGRLPKESEETSLGVAERMQTVVGILSSIHKFDERIILSSEIRKTGDGSRGEFKSLYLGLACAYYLAPNGASAGVGRPSANGWLWEPAPELADRIEEAMAIHEGIQKEAEFLPLPVRIGGVN
ncbi:MAG TPA: hypothetical protein DCS60_05645 [Opitutae bacterium]|nr:hypothetical protein [Opitutae bacterium]